ncbi:MAG: nuclear transport factor 2 family protein [Terriglobales bacterium]
MSPGTQLEMTPRAVVEAFFFGLNQLAGMGDPYELIAENATWEWSGNTPISVVARGVHEIKKFVNLCNERILAGNGRAVCACEFIEEGNLVVLLMRARCESTRGQPYNNSYFVLCEVKGGKLVRIVEIFDDALTMTSMFDHHVVESERYLPCGPNQ